MSDETNNQGQENTENSFSEAADNIKEEAKKTADDIKEAWNETTNSGENKKILAALMGILFGGLGVHKFILGYNKEGLVLLGITLVSIPLMCVFIGILTIYIAPIIGLIEGIIYLTKSDEEFYNTYQVGKKSWF